MEKVYKYESLERSPSSYIRSRLDYLHMQRSAKRFNFVEKENEWEVKYRKVDGDKAQASWRVGCEKQNEKKILGAASLQIPPTASGHVDSCGGSACLRYVIHRPYSLSLRKLSDKLHH